MDMGTRQIEDIRAAIDKGDLTFETAVSAYQRKQTINEQFESWLTHSKGIKFTKEMRTVRSLSNPESDRINIPLYKPNEVNLLYQAFLQGINVTMQKWVATNAAEAESSNNPKGD